MREASKSRVDNSTSGACKPQKENTATSGGQSALIPLDNSLEIRDCDFKTSQLPSRAYD